MMDKSKEILPKIRYGAKFIGNINDLDIDDLEAEGSDDSSFFVNKDPKPEFLGDICCFDNVLKLTVKAFFSCTLFITSKSEVLSELLKIKTEGNLNLEDIVRHMEEAPKIMTSIINATHNNVYIKEMFRYLVKARKNKPENETCPETLLQYNNTRWPSVYEALKRFLYFRPEVTKLLKRIRREAPKERESFKLKVFDIDEFTWDYLSFLRDILEVFFEPLMILQHDTRKTNHMTIPYVWKIVKELDELKSNVISQRNPFISLGLEKASKMILEYYPIRDSNIAPLKNLYLATMLDPRMKRGFFGNLQLPSSVVTAAEEYFYDVFDRYRVELEKEGGAKRRKTTLGNNWLWKEEKKMRYMYDESQLSEDDDEAEVRNYFAQERGHMRLSVGDYYQEHKVLFPTIYRMAKDYLSMMPISHPSKSLLTKVENMFIDKQDKLPPDTIKKLVILKSRGEVKDEASIYRDNEYE